MNVIALAELVRPAGRRAGADVGLPVFSITKHAGFVPSAEFFKKQVFSKDLSTYKRVEESQFAYATIHLDEGSIGVAPTACLISPMYTVFEVDESRIDRSYLLRYLKSPRALTQYARLGRGSVHRRKSISLEALGELVVPLPDLAEQRRLASQLDRVDAALSRRLLAESLLEALPEALFLESFSSRRAAATVDEVACTARGSIRTGPFGSQLLHSEFVNEGIAVLGLDNVVGNQFRWAERRYITEEKYVQLKRYTVRPGDVLISIMGTCGRCVVVPERIPTAINTKHICAITVNTTRVLPEYLRACFLWHPESRHHLALRAKGSIMDGLNMGIIKEMPLPVPSLDEQATFVRRLRLAERAQKGASGTHEQIRQLSAALQQRAFSVGA